MKENKKVRNVLQKYMQWPVVLSALVLCANGAVGLVSGKAGMVMAVFTVLYAARGSSSGMEKSGS